MDERIILRRESILLKEMQERYGNRKEPA